MNTLETSGKRESHSKENQKDIMKKHTEISEPKNKKENEISVDLAPQQDGGVRGKSKDPKTGVQPAEPSPSGEPPVATKS